MPLKLRIAVDSYRGEELGDPCPGVLIRATALSSFRWPALDQQPLLISTQRMELSEPRRRREALGLFSPRRGRRRTGGTDVRVCSGLCEYSSDTSSLRSSASRKTEATASTLPLRR